MEKLRFNNFQVLKLGKLNDICKIETGKFNNDKSGIYNVYGDGSEYSG